MYPVAVYRKKRTTVLGKEWFHGICLANTASGEHGSGLCRNGNLNTYSIAANETYHDK